MKGEVAKTEEAVLIEEDICLIDTLIIITISKGRADVRADNSPAFFIRLRQNGDKKTKSNEN